jgi:hypothetical protein
MAVVYYATFQCGHYNIFKKIKKMFFASENIKKTPSKVAHYWLNFFSVLPIGLKPAQITFYVP